MANDISFVTHIKHCLQTPYFEIYFLDPIKLAVAVQDIFYTSNILLLDGSRNVTLIKY